MEKVTVRTRETFLRLARDGALAFECVAPTAESLSALFAWIARYTPLVRERVYVIGGGTMNALCGLTGRNAYREEAHVLAVAREDLANPVALGIPKIGIGAEWLADLVEANARREALYARQDRRRARMEAKSENPPDGEIPA